MLIYLFKQVLWFYLNTLLLIKVPLTNTKNVNGAVSDFLSTFSGVMTTFAKQK